jgi:uncharacterized membrane protein
MNEPTITIVLRLIHILSGIFWVGAIFLIAGFLVPTVQASGPEGGRFMQHLMLRRRLSVFLLIAMLLTVISGFTMYARLVAATNGAWAGTPPGIGYGLGGLAAILAAVVGGAISGLLVAGAPLGLGQVHRRRRQLEHPVSGHHAVPRPAQELTVRAEG